jgi:hypothetical protein
MKNIRVAICLAVMLSALGIGAASASAHEFESSGGVTKGLQVGAEEFTVYPMKISCQRSVSKGSAPSGKFATYTSESKPSVCSTFGSAIKVNVSPAQWEYSAEETQTLLNEVTITPVGLGCHFTIPPQSGFAKESVLYEDGTLPATTKFPTGQKKLTIYSKLRGLAYTAFGWPCTGPKTLEALKEEKAETSEGEGGLFTGATHQEVFNGNLTWVE